MPWNPRVFKAPTISLEKKPVVEPRLRLSSVGNTESGLKVVQCRDKYSVLFQTDNIIYREWLKRIRHHMKYSVS